MVNTQKEQENKPIFTTREGFPLTEEHLRNKRFVVFIGDDGKKHIGKIDSINAETGKAIVKIDRSGGALKDILHEFKKTKKIEIDANKIIGAGATGEDALSAKPPEITLGNGVVLTGENLRDKRFVAFVGDDGKKHVGKIVSVDLQLGKAIVKIDRSGGALKDVLRGFEKTKKIEIDADRITGVGATEEEAMSRKLPEKMGPKRPEEITPIKTISKPQVATQEFEKQVEETLGWMIKQIQGAKTSEELKGKLASWERVWKNSPETDIGAAYARFKKEGYWNRAQARVAELERKEHVEIAGTQKQEMMPAYKVPIVTYHDEELLGGEKSPFARNMANLASAGYTFYTAAELADRIKKGENVPVKSICITFDDGYLSAYALAYPILKKYNIKATMFVIASDIPEKGSALEKKYTEFAKNPQNQGLWKSGDYWSAGQQNPKITWPMAKEMHDSGLVEIGSHTYDMHRKVGGTVAAIAGTLNGALEADLEKSIRIIEESVGEKPVSIAWPYGTHNEECDRIANKLGLTSFGFSAKWKNVTSDPKEKKKPFAYPRYKASVYFESKTYAAIEKRPGAG